MVAISFREVSTPFFFLHESPSEKRALSRVEALLWWRKVRRCPRPSCLGTHLRNELQMLLDPYFFGLESLDVNFGSDVVPNVVPVRDHHVSSPTSSRIQRVSKRLG